MTVIGLLHPGQMGASVGAAALARGANEVIWCSERRSNATVARAEAVGLTDATSVAAVVDLAEVILSVCPPDNAVDVASAVAACGFSGTYVDANAVSPATAEIVRLALAGCDVHARIVCHRSGHQLNAALVDRLLREGQIVHEWRRSA